MVNELPKGIKTLQDEIAMNMNMNFDKILNLFTFAEYLIKYYGLNSLKVTETILLSDVDSFNITSLFTKLVRLVVVKRD